MTELDWSSTGKRKFESGVDHGVLYVGNSPGVIWNGLTAISNAPTGGDPTPHYIDGVKYLITSNYSEYAGVINAYSSPKEFDQCEGILDFAGFSVTHQPQKSFGLSYRSLVGTDADPDAGYKIHLIYNAVAAIPNRDYASISESKDVMSLSWPITAKPIFLPGFKPTAHFILDSLEVADDVMASLFGILYGTSDSDPRLPTETELATFFDLTIPTTDTSELVLDGGSVLGTLDFVDGGGVEVF